MPTFNAPAAGGFLRGYLRTHLALQDLQLRQQQFEARQKLEKERIKIQQDLLKGKVAEFRLQQEQRAQELLTERQRQQGRREAGAAAAALLDPSLNLDPQAQGELQGIVTRQQAQEGNFTPVQKLLQIQEDRKRRRELAQSLDSLLNDLPTGQQAFGRAALQAYTGGNLDDSRLFQFFDRMSGSKAPTSLLSLSFMAAGRGPRAEQAKRALQLLPAEQHNMTTTHLTWLAQQGGETGKQAQAALDALTKLRQTGVRSRRRGGRAVEESPFLHPQLTPLPGGGVRGKGRDAKTFSYRSTELTLDQITPEIIDQMTPEEFEQYEKFLTTLGK